MAWTPLNDHTIRGAVQLVLESQDGAYAHPVFGPIAQWDVSNVTDMSNMFEQARSFNGDLSKWDVSKVEDMRYMFARATRFDDDLSTWNVSNVTRTTGMFQGAKAYHRSKILRWVRSFSRTRAIVLFWLEATAMSVEQHRIKRARLGVVDDPLV